MLPRSEFAEDARPSFGNRYECRTGRSARRYFERLNQSATPGNDKERDGHGDVRGTDRMLRPALVGMLRETETGR